MKIQLASHSNAFPFDLHVNRNPECVYYANHRLKLMPDATWVNYEGEDSLDEHSAIEIAELVECLPGVYTRTLKMAIDERDTDLTDMCVTCRALDLFNGIAAYLNVWNEFVCKHKNDHDGAGCFPIYYSPLYGGYVNGKALSDLRGRCPYGVDTYDNLPDGRVVKVEFFYWTKQGDIDGYRDLAGYGYFSLEIVNGKEA